MKKPTILLLPPLLSLLIISNNLISTEAHFFPNISLIPPSLASNNTAWAAFNNLAGCKKGAAEKNLSMLKNYFAHFGYYNSGAGGNFTDDFDDALENALKTYQANFNLDPTGDLDARTLDHIVRPRCGNPDAVNGTSTMRPGSSSAGGGSIHAVRHYSFFPNRPRWPPGRTSLTYAFVPENQLSSGVRGAFARAFERWSEVAPMNFTETASFLAADIRIGFFRGDHGDGEPFDGVMGTLAHAFSPPAGRLHLDDDENWVVDGGFIDSSPSLSSVDLESVAVHEIGHLLGLGHSSVEDAVMYPTIGPGTRKVDLARDDVMGIQELYGSNPNYVGSGPELASREENETRGSGAVRVEGLFLQRWIGLIFGLLLLLFV